MSDTSIVQRSASLESLPPELLLEIFRCDALSLADLYFLRFVCRVLGGAACKVFIDRTSHILNDLGDPELFSAEVNYLRKQIPVRASFRLKPLAPLSVGCLLRTIKLPYSVYVGLDLLLLQYGDSVRKTGLLLRGWKPDAATMSRILNHLYKHNVFADYRRSLSENEADQADRALGIEKSYYGNAKLRRLVRIAALPPQEASEALLLSSIGEIGWRVSSGAVI